MKKVILVFVLAAVVSVGTVFAQASHPNGLGIGVLWRGNITSWEGDGHDGSAALSLKLPSIPIFWAAALRLKDDNVYLGLTGDKYLGGGHLTSNILFWYIGLGGYVDFWTSGDDAAIGLGARLPIGLSVQVLDRVLEIFAEISPSLGISFWTSGDGGANFPDGGIGFAIGLRVWL